MVVQFALISIVYYVYIVIVEGCASRRLGFVEHR